MKFDYARDALKYLIKIFEIEKIYIPYYLCDVIRHAIVEVGAKPIFYHINNIYNLLLLGLRKLYLIYR